MECGARERHLGSCNDPLCCAEDPSDKAAKYSTRNRTNTIENEPPQVPSKFSLAILECAIHGLLKDFVCRRSYADMIQELFLQFLICGLLRRFILGGPVCMAFLWITGRAVRLASAMAVR